MRLEPILRSVAERAQTRRASQSVQSLRSELVVEPGRRERFVEALRAPGLSVIAECKRRSPSAGTLREDVDVTQRAREYARGGASALSILTEQDHFHGQMHDLAAAGEAGLPRLRKDFILDEGMVLESVAAGADAILLLAVCLPPSLLIELRQLAAECGLAVLLEVHQAAEMEIALEAQPDCLGVNARNLTTFEIDLAQVEELLPQVPASMVRVAESGIRTRADAQRAEAAGADAILVGETLMRASDPARAIRDLRGEASS